MKGPRITIWMLLLVVSSTLIQTIVAEDTESSPDDNNNSRHSPTDFLYFDPQENDPVMELVSAQEGGEQQGRGDFRLSNKPKMIEFYNPFCVRILSYFLDFSRHLRMIIFLLCCMNYISKYCW